MVEILGKKLIVYTAGGMCNRLRPISTAVKLAQILNRELFIFWEPDFRCPINYNELFDNRHKFIYADDMLKLENCSICISPWDMKQEDVIFGRSILKTLLHRTRITNKICPIGCDAVDNNIEAENLILYSGYYFRQIERVEAIKYIKNLIPKKEIQNKINKYEKKYNINKDVIGAHVRGSDININVREYDRQFKKIDKNKKIFICSDDLEYEDYFIKRYKKRIIRIPKENYAFKMNLDNESWFNNTALNKESVKEGLIDLYLLSKTNIQVGFEGSSFLQIARILGQ